MKKKNFLYLAALGLAAAACSSEDESVLNGNVPAPGAKMITETITASSGDNKASTRAAVDADAKFSWSEGDQIAVHVSDGKYYSTDALAVGAGGQATAEFSVSYPEGYSRDAFAVFPASIVATDAANYGQSGVLDVTLPASYTLAEVSDTKTPCPMIATNTGGSWEFSQLCGLLRLTVNNIPESTKRLEISFNGKKVCGDFSIASPVTPEESVIQTSEDSSNDVISITKDGTDAVLGSESLVLNIPLPTGTYSDIFVFAYNALEGGNPTVVDFFSFSKDVARKGGKKFTATMKYVAKDLADESFNNSDIDHAYIYQRNASTTATEHTITIANDQTVILSGVNINANNTNAIVCVGNANIVLNGSNTVKSTPENGTLDKAVIKAGTYEPKTTLTISGDGILNASITSTHNAAVIGADYEGSCGNIEINSGTITVSTNYGAAIGSGRVNNGSSKCGTITITGGTVNATAGAGAGIGSGSRVSRGGGTTSCDGITISGGTVTARAIDGAAIGSGKCEGGGTNSNSYCGYIVISGGTIDARSTKTGNDYAGAGIGSGYHSKVGNITISGGDITAIGSIYSAGIGAGGRNGQCGNILINGGSVNATGGYGSTYEGAGIGTGKGSASNARSICGTITITDGVTKVVATNRVGNANKKSIGVGSLSYAQCGSVTIGGVSGAKDGPTYTYEPQH